MEQGFLFHGKKDWHFEDMILERKHFNIYWPHLQAIPGLGEQLLLQISASIVQFQNAFDHFPPRTPDAYDLIV